MYYSIQVDLNWGTNVPVQPNFQIALSPLAPYLSKAHYSFEQWQLSKVYSSFSCLIDLSTPHLFRLFDTENEYDPIKTIALNTKHVADLHFERVSLYSNSLGESAVAFDFGPSLSRFHAVDSLIESLDIYPVFVLSGNGDVLLFYLSLKDLFIANQIYGPLKMTPAAEDNYGSDACSILCLGKVLMYFLWLLLKIFFLFKL